MSEQQIRPLMFIMRQKSRSGCQPSQMRLIDGLSSNVNGLNGRPYLCRKWLRTMV